MVNSRQSRWDLYCVLPVILKTEALLIYTAGPLYQWVEDKKTIDQQGEELQGGSGTPGGKDEAELGIG